MLDLDDVPCMGPEARRWSTALLRVPHGLGRRSPPTPSSSQQMQSSSASRRGLVQAQRHDAGGGFGGIEGEQLPHQVGGLSAYRGEPCRMGRVMRRRWQDSRALAAPPAPTLAWEAQRTAAYPRHSELARLCQGAPERKRLHMSVFCEVRDSSLVLHHHLALNRALLTLSPGPDEGTTRLPETSDMGRAAKRARDRPNTEIRHDASLRGSAPKRRGRRGVGCRAGLSRAIRNRSNPRDSGRWDDNWPIGRTGRQEPALRCRARAMGRFLSSRRGAVGRAVAITGSNATSPCRACSGKMTPSCERMREACRG